MSPAFGEARAEFAHALAKALESESGLDVAAVKEFVPATIQAIQENLTCYVTRSSWLGETPSFILCQVVGLCELLTSLTHVPIGTLMMSVRLVLTL